MPGLSLQEPVVYMHITAVHVHVYDEKDTC